LSIYKQLNPFMDGRRLTGIPRHIFNAEIVYATDLWPDVRISFSWYADIMLRDDPANAVHPYCEGENYGSLDMRLFRRFSEKYRVNTDVVNILNDRSRNGVPNADG